MASTVFVVFVVSLVSSYRDITTPTSLFEGFKLIAARGEFVSRTYVRELGWEVVSTDLSNLRSVAKVRTCTVLLILFRSARECSLFHVESVRWVCNLRIQILLDSNVPSWVWLCGANCMAIALSRNTHQFDD